MKNPRNSNKCTFLGLQDISSDSKKSLGGFAKQVEWFCMHLITFSSILLKLVDICNKNFMEILFLGMVCFGIFPLLTKCKCYKIQT